MIDKNLNHERHEKHEKKRMRGRFISERGGAMFDESKTAVRRVPCHLGDSLWWTEWFPLSKVIAQAVSIEAGDSSYYPPPARSAAIRTVRGPLRSTLNHQLSTINHPAPLPPILRPEHLEWGTLGQQFIQAAHGDDRPFLKEADPVE